MLCKIELIKNPFYFINAFGHTLTIIILYSFLRSKSQCFSAINKIWNYSSIINHSFSNDRIALPFKNSIFTVYQGIFTVSFGCSTHSCPHVRLIFIGQFLTGLINNSGCSHTRTPTHKNLFTRYGN